jgi:hypothetical protein
LQDNESLEAIYNEGKDALYQWQKVGDTIASASATASENGVS